jgi:hypothetical protein
MGHNLNDSDLSPALRAMKNLSQIAFHKSSRENLVELNEKSCRIEIVQAGERAALEELKQKHFN